MNKEIGLYNRIAEIRMEIATLRQDIKSAGEKLYPELNTDLLLVQSKLSVIGTNLAIGKYK